MHIRVPSLTFSIFRACFGLLMIPQVWGLLPHIHDLSQSAFVFHYPGLFFIDAYSHLLIDVLGYTAIAGAVMLALGTWPKIGAALFMTCFGYLFLIDQSFYNNHYYLWCIIAFLFLITETQYSISIIDLIKKRTKKTFDIRNQLVFALAISLVYFFGGTAKLNADWLQGYPMILLMKARHIPYPEAAGYFLSYTGLLFDLLVPFLLWRKAMSWWFMLVYGLFHFSNYFIFNIGEFPFVMLAAYTLFIPLSRLPIKDLFREIKNIFTTTYGALVYGTFFFIQCILPARALLLYRGNVAWHQQGYNFSWRMMLNNYEPVDFQFRVELPEKKDFYLVDFSKMLTYRQFYHVYHDPYMIWQLAGKLKKDAIKKYQVTQVNVFCKSIIKLNHHSPKPLIRETTDLATIPYYFFTPNTFINTF